MELFRKTTLALTRACQTCEVATAASVAAVTRWDGLQWNCGDNSQTVLAQTFVVAFYLLFAILFTLFLQTESHPTTAFTICAAVPEKTCVTFCYTEMFIGLFVVSLRAYMSPTVTFYGYTQW